MARFTEFRIRSVKSLETEITEIQIEDDLILKYVRDNFDPIAVWTAWTKFGTHKSLIVKEMKDTVFPENKLKKSILERDLSKNWEQKYTQLSASTKKEFRMLVNGHVEEGELSLFEQGLKKDIKIFNTFLLELLAEQII